METQDITSRYFQSFVTMPDGSLALPLTQIEFTYGRANMMDNSGVAQVAHALARPDSEIMDEATFKTTIDALTN